MKYASVIPLVGGMAFGNSMALNGQKPEYFISWEDFNNNEEPLYDYWPDVPYCNTLKESDTPETIDDKIFNLIANKVDFVSAVPPCSGLSMVNTGGHKNESMGRGSEAIQNRWMYNTAEFVLEKLQPKVLFGENAPGLFTKMGKGMADRLFDVAQKYGYSFSVYKTSTHFHGIPQRRMRTFYFFWKSKTAPILSWYNREMKPYSEYILEVPNDAKLQDHFPSNVDITQDIAYKWAIEKWGSNWRKEIVDNSTGTLWSYIDRHGLEEELIKYSQAHNDERGEKYFKHMLNKKADGKGYWDSSPHVYQDTVNAIISKNMVNTVHPHEDRILNTREYMHLMGLPHDFDINPKRLNIIAQNVPTCTARDMTLEVVKFIEGKLSLSQSTYLKQDNNAQKNESIKENVKELF